MIEGLIDTIQLSPGTTPDQITSPALRRARDVNVGDGWIYLFHGDHSVDLELRQEQSSSSGLVIPAGARWLSGPYRAGASDLLDYVWSAEATTATVNVLWAESGIQFAHGFAGAAASDKSDVRDENISHDTQSSWQNVCVVSLSTPRTLKEIKPYVVDESAGGDTTDARLLTALDARHSVSPGDPANDDAPTGSISDGDGWRLVDEISGMASGGEWPILGSGYEDRTHLVVLQIQQGSGQETTYSSLSADEAK
jgi:hypothetical protein